MILRKPSRPLVIGTALAVSLLVVALVVAFNDSFQTWAVRRYLVARPDLGVSVGRVSAGLGHVTLRDVVIAKGGARFAAPVVEADTHLLPLAIGRGLALDRVAAHGWTFTLTHAAEPPESRGAIPPPGAAVPPSDGTAPGQPFRGLLTGFVLPVDLSIDAAELSGTVAVAEAVVTVRMHGGNLGAGRDGSFAVSADAALKGADVEKIGLQGTLTARMDSARTFEQVGVRFDATASGGQLGDPLRLHSDLRVTRSGTDEAYVANIASPQRPLLAIDARLTGGSRQLEGSWKADLADADVSPFALGRSLPTFKISGAGRFGVEAGGTVLHAVGKLDAQIDNLANVNAGLREIGPVKVSAEVDVSHRASVLSVAKLDVGLATEETTGDPAVRRLVPVAAVQALQSFEFDPATRSVRPTDASLDLVGITIHGLPVSWAGPFLPTYTLRGDNVRGEMTAAPRAGGFTFRARTPLAVTRLFAARSGKALLHDMDVSLSASGDFTPHGWQAELNGVGGGNGGASAIWLHAKAGQLAGAGQPVKATGLVTADLAAIGAQPAVRDWWALKRGDASVEFSASLGSTKQVQAVIGIENLVAAAEQGGALPELRATVRADMTPDGRLTLSAPVTIEKEGRVSDLRLAGTVTMREAAVFDARVDSNQLYLDDTKPLLAARPATPETPGRPDAPIWHALSGSIVLQCKHVIYSDTFQLRNLAGTLRLADGAVSMSELRAGVGEAGQAEASGTVRFEAGQAQPYILQADVALREFDPGPLFLAINPRQAPMVEGRFSLGTHVVGRSSTLRSLASSTGGDLHLTSRGGVFRGLPVSVGNLVENSGKLAGWLAAAGDAIKSPFVGKKDYEEITSRSQAANELAKVLSAIEYDQLSLVIAHDDPVHARIKELTLISPEIRIAGSGHARRASGESVFTEVIDLELRVRARGRTAELMKYLGILDGEQDALGYAACTLPIQVEGALDRLDTTQLSNRLVALAVEKTGLTEKALDWINRLRGKGTN